MEAEDSSADALDTPDAPTPDTEEEERRRAEVCCTSSLLRGSVFCSVGRNMASIQEEDERKRQRVIELDSLLKSLLSNPEEVDHENLVYGRNFLYCVRDIEKVGFVRYLI